MVRKLEMHGNQKTMVNSEWWINHLCAHFVVCNSPICV